MGIMLENLTPRLRDPGMAHERAPDKAPNTVVAVMQKGYTLNERLLRPAMVVVAKEPEN